MNEGQPKGEELDPIEKAKAIIAAKKDQRLSEEELQKQEEQNRLNQLFERIEGLTGEISNISENEKSLGIQKNEHSTKYNNQTSAMKQAVDTLKGSSETSDILKEDKTKDDLGHTARRELLETVLGEIKDKRRTTKRNLKEVKKDVDTAKEQKKSIAQQIEDLKESPDGEKLIEKRKQENIAEELKKTSDGEKLKELKKQEYIEAVREEQKFSSNEKKSEASYLYNNLTKVNTFTKTYEKDIGFLKARLESELEDMLRKIHTVYLNAENSPEYKSGKLGEVDFEMYRKFTPIDVANLKISVHSYDSSTLAFPELDWQSSQLMSLIRKDIEEVDRLRESERKEMDDRRGRFLSGFKKHETAYNNLTEKSNFLQKITSSIGKYVSDFQKTEMIPVSFSTHKNTKEIPKVVRDYIGEMSRDAYPLSKDATFPEYKKTLTFDQLFRFAKQNDIPVDWQKAAEERAKLRDKVGKARKDYELIAGEGKASDIRIFA